MLMVKRRGDGWCTPERIGLMDAREQLLGRLRAAEVGEEAIACAVESGCLPTFAVEVALGDGATHTVSAVASAAGLSSSFVRELMQAFGRPDTADGESAFTDEDVELARVVRRMLDAGLPARELTEVARVLGLAMAQSADAVRQLVADAFLQAGDSEDQLGARYVYAVDTLAPLMPALLSLSFRAHLRDGISGELLTEAERRSGRLAESQEVAVAFADLVGYTALGDRLSAGELGSLAGRFAGLGVAVARRPVRLVKTIGDAMMFVSPDAGELVGVLIELRDRVSVAEPTLPEVRIGAALGAATPRAGDWFGPAVNVASRVADLATPGQLLATDELVAEVGDLEWKKRRKRNLKGLDGRLRVYSYEPGSAS
jgi:adenylate cyclase